MLKEQFEAGSFHSIIPNLTENYNGGAHYINIEYNNNSHEKILNDISNKLDSFDEKYGWKLESKETSINLMNILGKVKDIELQNENFNYYLCNGSFEWMDGRLLYYFMTLLKPNKIIEVGSGNSTLLMYNAKKDLGLKTKIICIDKNPHPIIKKMAELNEIILFEENLNSIELKIFESLGKNDILFIDSSHAVKMNSDVIFYFTKIFPLLKQGVIVQIHDIFLPFEYPLGWLNNGVYWNEQYMLYLFLQNSNKYRVLFSINYAKYKYSEKLLNLQKNYYENKYLLDRENYSEPFAGGSIWLRVI